METWGTATEASLRRLTEKSIHGLAGLRVSQLTDAYKGPECKNVMPRAPKATESKDLKANSS